MCDETGTKSDAEDGDKVAKDETETKNREAKEPKSVSFNQDVHVKRFGKPREPRGTSSEQVRKEPFTHLTKQELIDEANKVRAQADSVTCTADHPPEKFFSLPHRKKFKEDRGRRNSDDGTEGSKINLGRSTSDVNPKKRKERTSLSTLFRRAQRTKSPDTSVVVTSKPIAVVKRSKSDVSDLKSNTNITPQTKPIRKRSGSETEEFLKSLRNKKSQLSPIIESSPREDYFKKTPPLEVFQKQKLSQKDSNISDEQNSASENKKVNPVEKPPRYKTPEKQEPKPPIRTKRGKSLEKEKEKSPSIAETPKRKTDVKRTLLVDEIDSIKEKNSHPLEVKEKIKESIRKIEENIYGDKEMIHSSQQPPDKPPLTRGHTVDHIVRILKEDQLSPPPKPHLISPTNGTNTSQPFSYIKPSVSPDPNLFVRNTSPDRVPTPVNKMTDKGVVYAQVVRDNGDTGTNGFGKQTIHKTYSPAREKYGNFSDEDEGLGYEERHKNSINRFDYDYKNENENYNSIEGYNDSPIRPIYREYKLKSFEDFEPTYANEYPIENNKSHDFIDTFRGRADGMDTKRRQYEHDNTKIDLDFNELSHRRKLLESRLNARKIDRNDNIFDRKERINTDEPISRYLAETDPIYEAEKRRKATEKYVNETAKYYRQTLERDGFTQNSITEDYSKYDSDNHKVKYNTETRTFQKVPQGEVDRREFIDRLGPNSRHKSKVFPPEPEYEPPSLEFTEKPVLSPDEYKEKKYKVKKNIVSSHDMLHTGHKYKVKDDWFGKRKGHYASNPEIAKEREDDYANLRYEAKQAESYHNSLRRGKNKDRYYKEDFGMRRHDSGDSREYYRDDRSPRRYDIDNRLVDSGIENDFRKDSSGELHRSRYRPHESDDDVRNVSLFLASERRHTEDNYPSEQIYANGEYLAKFKDFRENGYRKEYSRDKSIDNVSHLEPRVDRYNKSPIGHDNKVSAKPPKAAKKLSGLEKMKQLFSRDSSKKSKKEKEVVQPKTRTRVLKSPEHLAGDDSEYRRYTDPEPSDIVVKKIDYECKADERRFRNSREDLDKYRSSDPRESPERKYRDMDYNGRYDRTLKEDRRYKERKEEKRRYHSSDRESDHHSRPSDAESDLRKSRSRTAGPLDSPALAERYRERRRLATPSPTPSPPRRQPAPPPATSAGNWFKSLDRLTARKRGKSVNTKSEKESVITTEDESTRKAWSKTTKPLNSPAKNLRFFGDTDADSDINVKQTVTKTKSHPVKSHGTLRKTISNSSTGIDEVDHSELSNKSHSLSNLQREDKSESPKNRYYKRNLQNISEIHSNSENESQFDRKVNMKPPISPYERSRSHSSSKTLMGSRNDVRRHRKDDRGSSSELRTSNQELSRDMKHRRRTPGTNSGESSTEGDSSHQSQRSVVYLHATTVGDIPDPGRLTRNRSRDDVSSVNSSNIQVRSTTKSFSIFAPWTPRHYNDQHDVHYAQRPRKVKPKEIPAKKTTTTRNHVEDRPTLQKNKSFSQTTLTRKPQNNRLTSSSTTLYRKPEKRRELDQNTTLSRKSVSRDGKKSQSSEILNRDSRERVSRSISMPKDNNKKAGWFKLSNKNKKQEINTRVR
ncbi:trichohyalin [Achroia grisella]|uniref:trichohyalin n=1 Tax=Achroia grisella TaxID=688607 RepID=UPI0027D2821E|nr:trichohyalin [Achroia grisella]